MCLEGRRHLLCPDKQRILDEARAAWETNVFGVLACPTMFSIAVMKHALKAEGLDTAGLADGTWRDQMKAIGEALSDS